MGAGMGRSGPSSGRSVILRQLRSDGSDLPLRSLLGVMAAVGGVLAGILGPSPSVVGTPVPVLSLAVLGVALASGSVDARAGLVAGAAAVAGGGLATAASTSVAAGTLTIVASLAGQLLVLLLASTLGPMVARTATPQLLALAVDRWPGRSTALRSPVGAAVLAGGLAFLFVQGWLAAFPVFVASAVPGAGFVETGPPAGAGWLAAGTVLAVGLRQLTVRPRPPEPPPAPLPRPAAAIRGVPGVVALVALVSSLYDGAALELALAAGLLVAIRATRIGLLPPTNRLLGPAGAALLRRVPGAVLFSAALLVSLVAGAVVGDDLELIQRGYLALLALLLLLTRSPAEPGAPQQEGGPVGTAGRAAVSTAATAAVILTVLGIVGPHPATAQETGPVDGVVATGPTSLLVYDLGYNGLGSLERITTVVTLTDVRVEPEGVYLTIQGRFAKERLDDSVYCQPPAAPVELRLIPAATDVATWLRDRHAAEDLEPHLLVTSVVPAMVQMFPIPVGMWDTPVGCEKPHRSFMLSFFPETVGPVRFADASAIDPPGAALILSGFLSGRLGPDGTPLERDDNPLEPRIALVDAKITPVELPSQQPTAPPGSAQQGIPPAPDAPLTPSPSADGSTVAPAAPQAPPAPGPVTVAATSIPASPAAVPALVGLVAPAALAAAGVALGGSGGVTAAGDLAASGADLAPSVGSPNLGLPDADIEELLDGDGPEDDRPADPG